MDERHHEALIEATFSDSRALEGSAREIRNTFAFFGAALYQAQCLEHEIVNAMVVTRLPERTTLTKADIDAFMATEFRNTLGELIKNLRARISLPNDLEETLANALRTRNWLAHDFFRERAVSLTNSDGRRRMIRELLKATALFEVADEQLQAITEPLIRAAGFTGAQFERARAELIAAGDQSLSASSGTARTAPARPA